MAASASAWPSAVLRARSGFCGPRPGRAVPDPGRAATDLVLSGAPALFSPPSVLMRAWPWGPVPLIVWPGWHVLIRCVGRLRSPAGARGGLARGVR